MLFRSVAKSVRLVNGNDLCGSADATWLLVAEDGGDLGLAFFSGTGEPRLNGDGSGLCGTFFYSR